MLIGHDTGRSWSLGNYLRGMQVVCSDVTQNAHISAITVGLVPLKMPLFTLRGIYSQTKVPRSKSTKVVLSCSFVQSCKKVE